MDASAAPPSRELMPAPETRLCSPAISGMDLPSTRRSGALPSPMPTKQSAITRPSRVPCEQAVSKPSKDDERLDRRRIGGRGLATRAAGAALLGNNLTWSGGGG